MKISSQLPYKYLFLRLKPSIMIYLITIIVCSYLIILPSFAEEKKTNTENNESAGSAATSAEETLLFDSHVQREVYQQLITELRCPKCQNQNIADSNADIAQDLRKKVYELILQNKSKAEIKQFMLERFGEFVLYKPKFSGKTLLLWLGPILLLFLVIFFVARIVFRNAAHLTTEEKD